MDKVFRLPFGETLGSSLEQAGLRWWELGEDYPYEDIKDSKINNLYSICECELLNPATDEKEAWYLIGIQKFYPYPFMQEGTKYRELTYYLCTEELDPEANFEVG